jgi:hypothetical protein
MWRSYDSVGDGHFVAIHRVRKCWTKTRFQRFPHARASTYRYLGGCRDPMCVTKRSSHASDLVRTSRWGVGCGGGGRHQRITRISTVSIIDQVR